LTVPEIKGAIGVVVQTAVTMLGFVLAALAVLATIAQTKLVRNMGKQGTTPFCSHACCLPRRIRNRSADGADSALYFENPYDCHPLRDHAGILGNSRSVRHVTKAKNSANYTRDIVQLDAFGHFESPREGLDHARPKIVAPSLRPQHFLPQASNTLPSTSTLGKSSCGMCLAM